MEGDQRETRTWLCMRTLKWIRICQYPKLQQREKSEGKRWIQFSFSMSWKKANAVQHTLFYEVKGATILFLSAALVQTLSLSLCCLELLLLWRYVMEEKRLNAGCRCTHLTRLPRFGFLHKLTCSNSLVTINASRGISTTNSEGICSSLRGCFFCSFDCFLN
jgi:hypothetical protein